MISGRRRCPRKRDTADYGFATVLDSFVVIQEAGAAYDFQYSLANGRKLYEYARRGKEVTRPERKGKIDDIEALDVRRSKSFQGQLQLREFLGAFSVSLILHRKQEIWDVCPLWVRTKGAVLSGECVTLQDVQEGCVF